MQFYFGSLLPVFDVCFGDVSPYVCADYLSLVLRKPVFGVSDQVPHKPGCTVTEGS